MINVTSISQRPTPDRNRHIPTLLFKSFVWDISIMGTRPGVVEYIGALMIIIGSVSASAMKSRAAAKALEVGARVSGC